MHFNLKHIFCACSLPYQVQNSKLHVHHRHLFFNLALDALALFLKAGKMMEQDPKPSRGLEPPSTVKHHPCRNQQPPQKHANKSSSGNSIF
mmetsp:Transcript_59079/g.175652  ORF Transcript_59079/g.175652 Transcript_59079/m.175652 type:complete len:91 (-) Transcript_59079:1098-1370(-)